MIFAGAFPVRARKRSIPSDVASQRRNWRGTCDSCLYADEHHFHSGEGVMERHEDMARPRRDKDDGIAADAAAPGSAEISRTTGTGSATSGQAGREVRRGGRSAPDTTTSSTTAADDIGDAVGPSSAPQGGTGSAGSGLGRASSAVEPPAGTKAGAGGDGSASGTAGESGALGSATEKGATQAGSAAGGGAPGAVEIDTRATG